MQEIFCIKFLFAHNYKNYRLKFTQLLRAAYCANANNILHMYY